MYAPKEHHNKLILNQEPDFYITSLSNLMDETLTLLPNLFVDKMVKNGWKDLSKFWINYQRM